MTDLILYYSQLTGTILIEIGNLIILKTNRLSLNYNQLSGFIPDEICNRVDDSPGLSNTQFYPPHPSCIENNMVFDQDNRNCN